MNWYGYNRELYIPDGNRNGGKAEWAPYAEKINNGTNLFTVIDKK